ncbi:MAG TPA: AarF/ABC1/UbiB kinase family protein [Methanobacterium sp.]|nr:AarF/ABC1/UbiB kinase family protein [Methanobacterium sp.]
MKLGEFDQSPNLKRLNQIIKVLGNYEFGYIAEKVKLKNKIPFKSRSYEYESIEELDATIPLRIRLVLQELGTTFIKLGQTLSTRPDLVGDDIAAELSKLQDDNPPVDFEIIKSVIGEELGDSPDNLFSEFNKEPLGSASIGQVHKAVLKNGDKVAIKIQKPGVEDIIRKDISIMRFLAKRVDDYMPQFRNYNLPGIVNEFERSILKEIDYNQEAMNITRFNYNFKDDETVYVPQVYKEYSTKKVLTMELIEGKKVSDVINSNEGYDKPLIAKRGIESFFKQVLVDGFFHADPHPANIYVLDNNIVCFLDYGMMGILDQEFRENLAELIVYFMENSVKGMINQLVYMGIINEAVDINAFRYELTDLMYRYYGIGLNEMHGGMNDLISLMRRYKIQLPREFVLLARGIGMLEDSGEKLDPNFNPVEAFKPMAMTVIRKKISPLRIIDFLKDNLFEFEHLLKTLPHGISKTLYKLEEGKLTLEIEHKDMERISNKISTALIISALLIGSSLIMQTDKGILILGFPFLGLIGFIISMILGLMLVLSILKHREI